MPSNSTGALWLQLLGGFQILVANEQFHALPTKKTQALLAYLALQPGQAFTRNRLATLLWGNTADEQARKSLRQAIYILRKALPATSSLLLVEGETIALNLAAIEVDAVRFERFLAQGALEALERAVALYRGDLLEGFSVDEAPFEEWLVSQRERLRERALEAFAKLFAHQSNSLQTERAIGTGVKLLALDPSQEVVHRALMRLYARQGRRAAALKQYQICFATLRRELGTDPEPETKQLYQDVLKGRTHGCPSPGKTAEPRETWLVPLESRLDLVTLESGLIGRQEERARLRDALDHVSRGEGRVVVIAGEAGIGKSCILRSLAADGDTRRFRILVGRSYRTEQTLAFGPWIDALRGARVIADIEALTPLSRAELGRLLPELDIAGGARTPHRPDRRRLFEAVTELVCGLAMNGPVLIIFEDLHWADEATLRLVARVARRIRESRIMIAVTMRDEELHGTRALRDVIEELSAESHFVRLDLPPLSQTDTTALARSLTTGATDGGALVARLDEQIWRMSDGNPFVVVETVRAIQEGASFHASEKLLLPERVRQVVGDRLARLSDQGRHLVSVAAVIGREFDFALLQRAAGLSAHKATEALEELVRRRVLHALGERFDFSHEWIRKVAYNQLLVPRRAVLHSSVARALEHLYAGSLELHSAALGAHYRAGSEWPKALMYFRQAGARAIRLSAYREAVSCFEEALEVLGQLPETRQTLEAAVDLRFDLQACFRPLGEFDRLRRCLQDAETPAKRLGDQRRLGWLSVYMSQYLRTAGHTRDAIRHASMAHALGDKLEDPSLRLGADHAIASAYFSLGDYRRTADLLRAVARSLDNNLRPPRLDRTAYPAVSARAYLTQSLAELGEFEDGVSWGDEGLRIADGVDHPMSIAYACLRLGNLYIIKGELDQARQLLERAHRLTSDRKSTFTAAIVTADLGYLYALLGRSTEGLQLLRAAMDAYESMNVDVVKARLLGHLGAACLLADRFDDAQTYAKQALAHARDRGERGYEAYALRLLGEIASRRDPPDIDGAEALYRESMTLAGKLGMRPLAAHCHHGLGALYYLAGKTHAAREHLDAAMTIFQQLKMRTQLERVAEGAANVTCLGEHT